MRILRSLVMAALLLGVLGGCGGNGNRVEMPKNPTPKPTTKPQLVSSSGSGPADPAAQKAQGPKAGVKLND